MLSYQFLAFVVVDDVEQWIRRRDVLQQAHVTKAESDFRLRQRKQLCFTKRIQFVACCLEFDFRKKSKSDSLKLISSRTIELPSSGHAIV